MEQEQPTSEPPPALRDRLRQAPGHAGAWLRRDAGAIVLFIALGLFALWPVLASPRTLVLGVPGDNYQQVYMAGWVGQALLLGEVPFIDPRLNFPDRLFLTATDVPLLNLVAVAPATWVLGAPGSYNLLLLLTHVLAGYAAYLWVRSLTGSRLGGAVAGTILLLAPYRIARSTAWPTLVSVHVLVLFFWALEGVVGRERPTARQYVLLGFATLAVGLTAQYYLAICLITGAAYALLRRWRTPGFLARAAGPAALSLACGALISAIPYLMAAASGVYTSYGIEESVRQWSLNPLNFITPAALHPIWGAWFQQLNPVGDVGEQTVYLGWVALALAGVGVAWGRRLGVPVWTWLGVAVVAAVFALGTDLHLASGPVAAEEPLWLPAYYLADLPVVNLARVWTRYAAVTLLFTALLAGVGAAAVQLGIGDRGSGIGSGRLDAGGRGRAGRDRGAGGSPRGVVAGGRPMLLGVLLVALVVVDFLPGVWPTTEVTPRPIDRWLAAQPGDFAVGFLPPGQVTPNYRAMLGSLTHGKQLPAFNHPEHRPAAYLDYQRRADKFPDRDSLDALRELGLRYLLVERAAYDGGRWPRWEGAEAILRSYPDVRFLGEEGGVVVIELVPAAGAP